MYDNDIRAVAGLSVAAEMGLSVPGDVSLLARDDSQLCRLTHPTLSAIAMSHDVYGFGAEAARTLFGGDHRRGVGLASGARSRPDPRGSTAPPRM
ncbi:substrate-binding domain-containing protein [Streptomyces avermitilis]